MGTRGRLWESAQVVGEVLILTAAVATLGVLARPGAVWAFSGVHLLVLPLLFAAAYRPRVSGFAFVVVLVVLYLLLPLRAHIVAEGRTLFGRIVADQAEQAWLPTVILSGTYFLVAGASAAWMQANSRLRDRLRSLARRNRRLVMRSAAMEARIADGPPPLELLATVADCAEVAVYLRRPAPDRLVRTGAWGATDTRAPGTLPVTSTTEGFCARNDLSWSPSILPEYAPDRPAPDLCVSLDSGGRVVALYGRRGSGDRAGDGDLVAFIRRLFIQTPAAGRSAARDPVVLPRLDAAAVVTEGRSGGLFVLAPGGAERGGALPTASRARFLAGYLAPRLPERSYVAVSLEPVRLLIFVPGLQPDGCATLHLAVVSALQEPAARASAWVTGLAVAGEGGLDRKLLAAADPIGYRPTDGDG